MSGLKHTPWTHEWVEESSDWVVFGCVYPPDADGIAHQPGICTLSDSCDEDEARLIAAAPDLLAVAIKSHEPYEGLSEVDIRALYGPEEAELAMSLRAAISRATGADTAGGGQ